MGLNNFGLGFNLNAKDNASAVMEKVGGSLGKLEKDGAEAAISMQEAAGSLKDMGGRMSAAGQMVTAALLDAGAAAGTFQKSLAKAATFTNATASEMELMRAAAMNADLVLKGFSFDDQAAALGALGHEFGNVHDAVAALVPTLTLAKVTGADTGSTAGMIADILGGFNMEAKDSAVVVDRLAFAMKKFGLKADELEASLMPTVGAARLMGASFEDTLSVVGVIATGLGNVKKSAGAVTLAMNQLADPKVQAEIKGLGVEVKDANGQFRPMIDILGDVAEKTKGMTAAQKAQSLASVFGAKGAGGLNIVVDQLSSGVKSASGQLLKGADAVAELRRQMEASAGAAEELAMSGINTLPQASSALEAAVKSFKTAFGEPVNEILVPLTKGAAVVFSRLAKGFSSLSPTVKRIFVVVAGGAAALASFIGAMLTAAGSVVALVLAGKALLFGLAAVVAAVGVLTLALAPLILLGGALYVAWTRDIGGLATSVRLWMGRIQLAFEAVGQLISNGGFSGAVRDELNRAENTGIKQFAINVFLWFSRVKNFMVSVGQAFEAGMSKLAPVIEKIVSAVQRLAGRFASTKNAASANQDAFDAWGRAGAKVADALVWVVDKVAIGILAVLNFADGAAEAFGKMKGVFTGVWGAVKALFAAFSPLIDAISPGGGLTVGPQSAADAFRLFGNVIATSLTALVALVSGAINGVTAIVNVVVGVIGAVRAIYDGFVGTIVGGVMVVSKLFKGDWAGAWNSALAVVEGWGAAIIKAVASVVGGVAGMVDRMAAILGKSLNLQASVTGAAQGLVGGPRAAGAAPVAPSLPAASTAPATTPGVAAAGAAGAQSAAIVAAAGAARPTPVELTSRTTIQLDGATLAEHVEKQRSDRAARGFTPTPAPT